MRRKRRTAAELASAQTANTGLTAQLGELREHREELKAQIGRQAGQLEDERVRHRREVETLRGQLDGSRAAAPRADGPSEDESAPGTEDDQVPTGAQGRPRDGRFR
ncbi:hypothetical protein [Streptomyces sp. LUP30]|uniref:hypothetical protein n=1 Tax=Streptomyces sp. LUP30 TaxID=1890285 RepID=UPI0008518696|nr:hypothetical protein [Streptomyces sp. LUP30]